MKYVDSDKNITWNKDIYKLPLLRSRLAR